MCFGPLLVDSNPNITSWLQAVSDNQVFITQSSDIDTDALVQGAGLAAGASFTYGSQSILAGHVYYWDATNSVFVDVVQINSMPETTVAHTLASYADTTGDLESRSLITAGANNTLTGSSASTMIITTASAATPAAVQMLGALATGTNVAGSAANITAGASNGSAAGGAVTLNGGAAGATGVGGKVGLYAAAGGATSGAGGVVELIGGAGGTGSGAGGNVTLTGGAGTAASSNGGSLVLAGGAAGSGGVPGSVVLSGRVSQPAAATTSAGALSTGTVTLVAGTATVSTTAVTASSQIRLWRQSIGSTGANPIGMLSAGTIVAGTSFVINAATTASASSLVTTDVSVVGWELVN